MDPHPIPVEQREDWNKFVVRFGEALKKRHPDDPVLALIPQFADDGVMCVTQVISHHLRPFHLVPIIMHLTAMLAKAYPEVDYIMAFKAAADLHLGQITTADVTKGLN